MEKAWPSQEKTPVIKLAQYLAGLMAQQEVWSEAGKALLNFFGADLVAFGERRADGEIGLHHWAFSDQDFGEAWSRSIDSSQSNVESEISEAIAETLESGFLTSRLIATPEPLSIAFLPISQGNQVTTVMLAGHRMSKPFPNELLDIYLAAAGLVGTISARLASERELRGHRRRLEALVKERTAELTMTNEQLEQEIVERKQAEERVEHLNHVLRAINNVNQLIVREKDRGRMIQGACDVLTETRGYHNAWIALLDTDGRPVLSDAEGLAMAGVAGLGEEFLPLVGQLKRGELPTCGQIALAQSQVVVTDDPPSNCADCPLATNYAGRGGMTVRLEQSGKIYGLLCASIPAHLIPDEEEQVLLREVAGDIALALHSIELEEKRKRAEEELVRAAREWQTTFDATRDAIWIVDHDQRILRCNGTSERLFQRSQRELIGEYCWEIVHGTKEPIPECPLQQARSSLRRETMDLAIGDGWFQVTVDPILDVAGQYVGAVHIINDITERKRAEQALKEYSERLEEMVEERTRELEETQEQLIRQEKLAVLGQLAGGVGHELRNPLGAIKNAAYYFSMVLDAPDAETQEMLEILDREVWTAEKIISGLLDYARTRPPTRYKVDLNAVIQDVLSRTPLPDASHVEVALQLDMDLPLVLADPDQLAQVFDNIIRNGVEAMPNGGRLFIQSERRDDPGDGPEWAVVSIADTGQGIPEEARGKIFEPLFTTKAKGIGLGLALVKTLVEGHGGTIGVESQSPPEKGSTFTVRLPVGI